MALRTVLRVVQRAGEMDEDEDDLDGLLESYELPEEDEGPGFYFPDAPLLDEDWDSDGL